MPNFFLQLQKYDFQLQHAPDKTMLVSAWKYKTKLSQSYLNDVNPEFDKKYLNLTFNLICALYLFKFNHLVSPD